MEYHPVTKQITDLLTKEGVEFKTFEHEPVRTSQEAAALRPEYSLEQGAKAIIIKAKYEGEKKFLMLVMPAHKKFSSEKLKELGIKSVRFAFEEEVGEVTDGILPGGVPPFGGLFGLPLFVDESLFENEEIIFNAGDKAFSVAMKSSDYKKVLDPRVESFAE